VGTDEGWLGGVNFVEKLFLRWTWAEVFCRRRNGAGTEGTDGTAVVVGLDHHVVMGFRTRCGGWRTGQTRWGRALGAGVVVNVLRLRVGEGRRWSRIVENQTGHLWQRGSEQRVNPRDEGHDSPYGIESLRLALEDEGGGGGSGQVGIAASGPPMSRTSAWTESMTKSWSKGSRQGRDRLRTGRRNESSAAVRKRRGGTKLGEDSRHPGKIKSAFALR